MRSLRAQLALLFVLFKKKKNRRGSSITYGPTVSHSDNTALHKGKDYVYGEVNSIDKTGVPIIFLSWLIGMLQAFAFIHFLSKIDKEFMIHLFIHLINIEIIKSRR